MEIDMESSPQQYDPLDLSSRERYRRFRKRTPGSSLSPTRDSPASRLDEVRSNAALFLEDIKQEVESLSTDHGGTPLKKRPSIEDSYGVNSLKTCKLEDDIVVDNIDTTISLFESLLDSALEGCISMPELIIQFERSCRNVSDSIRYGSNERHRIIEDKLMKQKAKLLLDEAASWSLLWHLFGKENEDIPEDLVLVPTTSHLEACKFVAEDNTAQLCLRVVQWLEGLASKALDLDNKVHGSHVGTYLPTSGIWHHTQRFLKKGASNPQTVHHLDFDAPTREHAQQLQDDKKQDESLLEDVWTLTRAGRLEEACNLCRSAGQPWRAATLCPFGGLSHCPSVESLIKNGKNRTLQAIELESGIAHQWRLWKWSSYCASEKIAEQNGAKFEAATYAVQCSNLKRILPICTDWESACWAVAKSWLDNQVDMELLHSRPGGMEQYKNYEDSMDKSPGTNQQTLGPDSWPLQVVNQQPRDVHALLQKLHSGDMLHEAVTRACKEQHRQIEMNLMLVDIPSLLDLIWSWICPSQEDEYNFRPHGDPQMMRFGAHLVLVLRYLLGDQMKDAFHEKLMSVGDLILHTYTMFLFARNHEDLVGIYASQLANHRCIDLFVRMMELRLNSSVHVKYKIFLSSIKYLPFCPGETSKGSFEEIIERVLSRSREIKAGKYDESCDVAEQHRLQSVEKAMVVQWLCFTPPSTIKEARFVCGKLLLRALMHSNILFREFALISMWRVPQMPSGAHALLSLLAEPLKQPIEDLLSNEDPDVSENLKEFQDWSEYYSCDATYRKWLKIELENAEVSDHQLSMDEKQTAFLAAKETLDASLLLLQRKESPWLIPSEECMYEAVGPTYLELHATAMLCLPSGECLSPDPNICTTLMSALYSSVTEEEVLHHKLMVNVCISQRDSYCIEIVLRCLATEGDGVGQHEANDGGILGTVIAAGFKGELARFHAGVTLEISRLDAWYSREDGSLQAPATYILWGLCRKCCIPEIILRCMQVSVKLVESGYPRENHDELIDIVTDPESGFLHLFSQTQLQEFLLFEREFSVNLMELQEGDAS